MRPIPHDCGWEGLVAPSGRRRERGESRPLRNESETFVRLLAGAYRVISKHLGESRFSGVAAGLRAERRRLLDA